MEFSLLFLLVILVPCVGSSRMKPFRLQMVSQTEDGAYDFAYDTGDGAYHIQSRDNSGTVTGKFAYVDPSGKLREIDYTADRNGFRPHGDIHPQRINRFKARLSGSSPNPVVNSDSNEFVATPRLNDFVGQGKASGLKSEEIIGPAEVELVVPGQGSDPGVTMKSVAGIDASSRASFPVAALLSTGNLPVELRDAHPRVSLESNLQNGQEKLFSILEDGVSTREKSAEADGPVNSFLGNRAVVNVQAVEARSGGVAGQGNVITSGPFEDKVTGSGGFLSGDFQRIPDGENAGIVGDKKFRDGLYNADIDGGSKIPGERKFARNIEQFQSGNLFYPPVYQRTLPFVANLSPLPVIPVLPEVKAVKVSEEIQPRNEFSNEESTLLTKNQGTRLKSLLEKLLTTMTTDNLLLTLENLASLASNNEDNAQIFDNSTSKPTTDQPQTEELLHILSTLHNFLQKTNLTRIIPPTNIAKTIDIPNVPTPQEDIIPEKFPDATIDGIQSPVVGTPLYLPVEGVRNINGEKFLERSYIPFTRRYGYVYTQRGE